MIDLTTWRPTLSGKKGASIPFSKPGSLSLQPAGLGWQLAFPALPTARVTGLHLAELDFHAFWLEDFISLCCREGSLCRRALTDDAVWFTPRQACPAAHFPL